MHDVMRLSSPPKLGWTIIGSSGHAVDLPTYLGTLESAPPLSPLSVESNLISQGQVPPGQLFVPLLIRSKPKAAKAHMWSYTGHTEVCEAYFPTNILPYIRKPGEETWR